MKQGDEVTIKCIIDACLFGYEQKMYRIRIGEKLIWIPAEYVEEE